MASRAATSIHAAGESSFEAELPWVPTACSTLRACLEGHVLRASVMSKTPNKGGGMNWAQQDAALGERPGLRAGFRPEAKSWLL